MRHFSFSACDNRIKAYESTSCDCVSESRAESIKPQPHMSSARHVSGWENPYTTSKTHNQEMADINYRKVLTRKAERLFSLQMKSDGSLDHFEAIKDQLAAQDRGVVVQERKVKHVVAKPTIRQPLDLRPIHTIDGPVRAVEIAQGGATTWTSENDGGISVRSGISGKVVISIPPREDESTVDVLFSTATHMWAGLSDGTVVVFDHLVFVQVTEGGFHTAPVTGFATLSDGRMLSTSEDGSLIKWDSEAKNFEAITRIVPQHLGPITAVCSKELLAFCGSSTGNLISLDSTRGVQVCSYEGHGGAITSVCSMDDYLYSGSVDCTVRIWNINSGAPLKIAPTDTAPCAILPLSSVHRLWVGFTSGLLQVWCSRPDDGFCVERTIRVHEGRPLLTVKAMTAIETLKIWTLASDGVNKVWSSMYNRAEEGMKTTIDALRAVITQDTIELDKWRALALRLEDVERRRKLQLSNTLLVAHRDTLLRRFMWTWTRFVRVKHEHRRRRIVSEKLLAESNSALRRRAFGLWYAWYREAQRATLKRKFAKASATLHETNLKSTYAMTCIFVSREERMSQLKVKLIDFIATLSDHSLRHSCFRRWLRFVKVHQDATSRQRNAKALEWFNEKNLLRRYMSLWMKVEIRALQRKQQAQYTTKLSALNQLRVQQNAFLRWSGFTRLRHLRREQSRFAVLLLRSNSMSLLSRAYSRWLSARENSRLRVLQDENDAMMTKLAHIRQRYSDMSVLLEEKRKIAALQKKGLQEEAALERAQARVTALERERLRLQEALAKKELAEANQESSISEQLQHVMSQLKAHVINFYADAALFHQTKERIRAGQPITKLFLEAHQTVKRVVVDVTRNPHISAFERWPLTPELLYKIPPHNLAVVLTAIKTMIITFDIMSKQDHDQLTSDQEIVLNGQWLLLMAQVCVAHKKKLAAVRK